MTVVAVVVEPVWFELPEYVAFVSAERIVDGRLSLELEHIEGHRHLLPLLERHCNGFGRQLLVHVLEFVLGVDERLELVSLGSFVERFRLVLLIGFVLLLPRRLGCLDHMDFR